MSETQVTNFARRPFHAFLSHAHANQQAVAQIYGWLETAGFRIWYDARNLAAGNTIQTVLPDAIVDCRGMILALSPEALKSGWVQAEYGVGMLQRTKNPDFCIVPLRLEECEVPGFLQTTKWLDAFGGQINLPTAEQLLNSFYKGGDGGVRLDSQDVFVSRTWRTSEAGPADAICRTLIQRGFRLIGDSKDQQGFVGGYRVRSIMQSCGAAVAILPDRGEGQTSPYMIEELRLARELGLPLVAIADPGVVLPNELGISPLRLPVSSSSGTPDTSGIDEIVRRCAETLADEWKPAQKPHYVFFATNLDQEREALKQAVVRLVERVTAMPCVLGDHIREGQIQSTITNRIGNAFFMIADISEENLNTCIEAGVARGAEVTLHLIARGPRRRPPFLFRDLQVWFYDQDIDVLPTLHHLIHPYRRRVINYELS